MQHLFTGSATRRPTVNLGGARSNPQATHQDLVLRARLEREGREADRQRSKAAGKIQVSYPTPSLLRRFQLFISSRKWRKR